MTASTAEGAPVAALRAALLCLLALLMPTGLFMAVAAPVVEETLPLFAAPGIAVGEVVALLVIAALIVLGNLLADLFLAVLDPRIRYS